MAGNRKCSGVNSISGADLNKVERKGQIVQFAAIAAVDPTTSLDAAYCKTTCSNCKRAGPNVKKG